MVMTYEYESTKAVCWKYGVHVEISAKSPQSSEINQSSCSPRCLDNETTLKNNQSSIYSTESSKFDSIIVSCHQNLSLINPTVSVKIMASFSRNNKKYDVFVSFRAEDTRDNFTSHLYSALSRQNIQTFIDDQLNRGDDISESLLNAMKHQPFQLSFSLKAMPLLDRVSMNLRRSSSARESMDRLWFQFSIGLIHQTWETKRGLLGFHFRSLKKDLRRIQRSCRLGGMLWRQQPVCLAFILKTSGEKLLLISHTNI